MNIFSFIYSGAFMHVSPSCQKIADTAKAANNAYGVDLLSAAIDALVGAAILYISMDTGWSEIYFAFAFQPIESAKK